jgi:predicted SnoaL-like aldol condensation-catalyzing enzyme
MRSRRTRNLRAHAAIVIVALVLAGCETRSLPPPAEGAPLSTRDVAKGFLRQAFADNDVRGAYERYSTPDFKQHDPEIADGWEGLNAYLAELARNSRAAASDGVNVNNIVLVDGDLFALHHHAFTGPDDAGRVSVDIWRVDRGKIVEHWAVRQGIPSTMAHANGMACGKGDDYAGARLLGDTIAEPTCGLPNPAEKREESLAVLDAYAAEFWKGNVEEPILRWFSSDYRQHSPVIADGVAGAVAFLQNEYGKGEDKMPKFGQMRTVAEGGYVLRHRLQLDYGAESWSANIDIFRISGGKISEHWDLRQEVPDRAQNSNGLW